MLRRLFFCVSLIHIVSINTYAQFDTGEIKDLAEESQDEFPVDVTIRAIDRERSQVIPHIRVCEADDTLKSGKVRWHYSHTEEFRTSPARFTKKAGLIRMILRVDAAGYRPVITRSFRLDQMPATLLIPMQRDPGYNGTVSTPDGEPAHQAQVGLCTWTNTMVVSQGRFDCGKDKFLQNLVTITDEKGLFHLPPEIDPWIMVICHESGYLQLSQKEYAEATELRLQAWGELKGNYKIGEHPVANQKILLSKRRKDLNLIFSINPIVTDGEGRFHLNNVAPVEWELSPLWTYQGRHYRLMHYVKTVDVASGAPTKVDVVGMGADLVGQLVFAEDSPEQIANYEFQISVFHKPPPGDHVALGGGHRQAKAAHIDFLKSLPDQTLSRDKLAVNQDGSFRIRSLPESSYTLLIEGVRREERTGKVTNVISGLQLVVQDPQSEEEEIDLGNIKVVPR